MRFVAGLQAQRLNTGSSNNGSRQPAYNITGLNRFLLGSVLLGGAVLYMKTDQDAKLPILGPREAEALSKHDISQVTYDENKYCVANKVLDGHLEAKQAGSRVKEVTLFHLYDSKNELHNQFSK